MRGPFFRYLAASLTAGAGVCGTWGTCDFCAIDMDVDFLWPLHKNIGVGSAQEAR